MRRILRALILTLAVALVLDTILAPDRAMWGRQAFTLIGQDYEECNTSAATCTFGTGVAANSGDLVVVLASNRDFDTIASISDGVNGAYTCPAGLSISVGGSAVSQACYFINSGAGTVTPVITWSASGRGHANFQVWRPTGTVTADAEAEGTNASGTAHVTPTLSTGANAQLVVCGFAYASGVAGEITAGSGYTLLTDNNGRWSGQYDITSVGSGSFTCDMTTTNASTSAAIAMSFNDSGGGGSTCNGGLLMRGIGSCE